MPTDLPKAVVRLTALHESLTTSDKVEDSSKQSSYEEFTSIAKLLPRLAADSDIDESQWNKIDAVSKELVDHLQDALEKSHDQQVQSYRDHKSEIKKLLDGLASVMATDEKAK